MTAAASGTVTVGFGPRTYDIAIGPGLLERAGAEIAPHLKRPWTVVVTDENVFAAQGARLAAGLEAHGVQRETIVLPAGEKTKSFSDLERLVSRLLDLGVDRGDLIVAFGGGVVGDLVGFAAAILRRGCRFVQIPTSLLAQVDSAVGGKTAINLPQGKNLIGAFHQPSRVLADIDALQTLPARELRAGYAEIVKYAALGDAAFFDWLEANGAGLLAGDAAARARAIETSCRMKAAIVEEDEREAGRRALLNLGHTFGHALEAAFGYSRHLLHGEAVAAGMSLAFDYSVHCGHCPADEASRLKDHLRAVGLPAGTGDIDGATGLGADEMLTLMMQDKKVEAGALSLILARRIGEAFIERNADPEALKEFLKRPSAR